MTKKYIYIYTQYPEYLRSNSLIPYRQTIQLLNVFCLSLKTNVNLYILSVKGAYPGRYGQNIHKL